MASALSPLRRRGSTTRLQQRLQLALLTRISRKGSLVEKGFTLVELLVVVAIIAVLAGIALPSLLGQRDKANVAAANAQGRQLMTACQVEGLDNSPDYTEIDANLKTEKVFGKIKWTPTVTASACSAVTTGATTTQGSWTFTPSTGVVAITETK